MNNTTSIIPDYTENKDKAAEYLRMVLPMISKCKFPANPINYSICYEYVSGKNAPLQEALNEYLDHENPIPSEISNELYKQFVLNGSPEKIDKIGSGLKNLVQQTLVTLENTKEQATSSADNFANKSELLTGTEDASMVQNIVQSIIAETQGLVQVSNGLKNQLDKTNAEVSQLRQDLEKMKQSAETDALTGLLNRRAFDTEMAALIKEGDTLFGNTFLLLLDIDHFKRINDNYGHLVGDKVLRYTSKLLKQFVEDKDMVARYGGEEMAILIPKTDSNSAMSTAINIREALASSRLQRKDNGDSIGQITLSIGVSCLRKEDTIDTFIDRADTALYKAKDTGRNRVINGEN